MEGVLAGVDELKGKQKENVQHYRDQALLSKELVTIERDVPIEQDWDAMEYDTWDRQKLAALFVELKFNTLGKRVLGEGSPSWLAAARRGLRLSSRPLPMWRTSTSWWIRPKDEET